MGVFSVAVVSVTEDPESHKEEETIVWSTAAPVEFATSREAAHWALIQASRGHDDTRRLGVYVNAWQRLTLETRHGG
jgi:hypothetical protein